MNLEDTRHNLKIIGKVFLVLGLVIIPITILSYNSINFLFDSDWISWDDPIHIGFLHIKFPYELFYAFPAIYGVFGLFTIAIGIGLIYDLTWSKKWAILPSVLLLLQFPFGTALGLFVLFQLHKDRELTQARIQEEVSN